MIHNLHNRAINMKTLQLILILLFTSQTMAEPRNKGAGLDLTEEQQVQMQVVKQKMQERLEAAREEIKGQAHAEMAEFLTAEQMQQVESHQQNRKGHKKMRKHNRGMNKSKRAARKEAENTE